MVEVRKDMNSGSEVAFGRGLITRSDVRMMIITLAQKHRAIMTLILIDVNLERL